MEENTCLSSAEVVPGELKRCIRAKGHIVNAFVKHLWVEAPRTDGIRIISTWDDNRNVMSLEYVPTYKRADP